MSKSHKYAVVHKETGKVYKTFEYWREALYCITDSFGPEGYKVEAIELEDTTEMQTGTVFVDKER